MGKELAIKPHMTYLPLLHECTIRPKVVALTTVSRRSAARSATVRPGDDRSVD
jgi:hypothetical protein